ncbi:MAG: hypothetical protein RL222_1437, partial [Bacteroidota bacterium]
MWRYFSLLLLMCAAFTVFSASGNSSYVNPHFQDSILKYEGDSAKWKALTKQLDIHRESSNSKVLQPVKPATVNISYLLVAAGLFSVVLFLRLILDDFFYAVWEGMVSIKKYEIYLRSKKYDSYFAVFAMYLSYSLMLALLLYVGLDYFTDNDFTDFDEALFLRIAIGVVVFYSVRYLVEFIFNLVIGTQRVFKAYFLYSLFSEFALSLIGIVVVIIFIYNDAFSFSYLIYSVAVGIVLFVVFNIVRSYQLLSSVRIPVNL